MKLKTDNWMTAENAAKVLKVRPSELKLMPKGNRIRVRKSGNALLYRKQDVERVRSEREYLQRMKILLRQESAKCRMAALVIRVQRGAHPGTAYPKLVFQSFAGSLQGFLKLGKVVGVVRGKSTAQGWLFTAVPLPEFRGVADVARFLEVALDEYSRNLNSAEKTVAGGKADLN